jgi:hypothetical protein
MEAAIQAGNAKQAGTAKPEMTSSSTTIFKQASSREFSTRYGIAGLYWHLPNALTVPVNTVHPSGRPLRVLNHLRASRSHLFAK